jgi:hypothetical protein
LFQSIANPDSDIGGFKMSWLEHHRQSESFGSQAEVLNRQGETEAAQKHYAMAAESEVLALNTLEAGAQRTLGITVVSAAALLFKAQQFSQTKLLAYRWLASQRLPNFSVVQLEEIFREILTIEAAVAV